MNNAENRTLSISKTFNVPVKDVWEAWTEPDHLIQWWAPQGMQVNIIEHDFRVGGRWKYMMPMPDGSEFISEGQYLEIVPLQKIVTTADFRPMTENVELHVLFEADGDRTNFTFSVVHQTEEYKLLQEKMGFYNGWGTAFVRLEQSLQQMG
jgi:uncharacterized protein YndB with AHSA1/START domain